MHIRDIIIILFFSLGFNAMAQSSMQRAKLNIEEINDPLFELNKTYPIPLPDIEPFLSFYITWQGENQSFEVRFSNDGNQWSDWQTLHRDPHNQQKKVTEFFITDAKHRFFQLRSHSTAIKQLSAHFFSPGTTPGFSKPSKSGTTAGVENCEQPTIISREEWCPSGNCPKRGVPQFTKVSHLIVHHSAGTNSANDWSAIVRAIWDLHVNGNGWTDIGYNYLIDPDGKVYNGRGEDILGAHFCARNSNTMGVCVMGNFQNQTPTEKAVTGLVELLSWKAFKEEIDPVGRGLHSSSGLNLLNISGHREGCATACPGDQFFPSFFSIRNRVNDSLQVCSFLTNVHSQNKIDKLNLTPNPAHSQLQVSWNGAERGEGLIEIFGLDGQKQSTSYFEKFSNQAKVQINIEDLEKGYYLIRINFKGATHYGRFIKN